MLGWGQQTGESRSRMRARGTTTGVDLIESPMAESAASRLYELSVSSRLPTNRVYSITRRTVPTKRAMMI